MTLNFDSKEQALAWVLYETERALQEALGMPSILLPAAVQAVITENHRSLEKCGYYECPKPREEV